MTYDTTLTKLGKELFGNKYIGTFSYDELPELDNKECAIINTDEANKPGVHWLAVYKEGDILYGYDSFGRPMDKNLMTNLDINITSDIIDFEQKKSENNCGARCIAWLQMVYRHGIKKAMLI